MLTGYIRGQELRISTPEIAADSIKSLEAEFHFAGRDWDGYVKTAYFINGTSKFTLVLADDRITADMGLDLTAGEWEVKLSGVKGDSRITTTTEHIYVREFGSTDGTLPDVTATQAEQILAKIGDLANLTTEDKTNLVAAINEAAKSGGGSGGGKDGTGIASITYKGEDEDGGNVYTVLLTDGTSYDITAPKGAKGDKGDTGATGPQGPAGAPGKDGAGMDITGATIGQIAKITAVDLDGKPTAWEPVDMPSGGGSNWVKVYDGSNTIAEEISVFEVDLTKSDSMKEFQLWLKLDKNTAADWGANKNINVTVNGETIGYYILQSRLDSNVECYIERSLEAMTAAKRCLSTVKLDYNVATPSWMVEQGVTHKNNGKLSIAFPAPYAGKITAKVFGRY
nr:MAG TPA: nucleoid-associated protein [Caudoviricetes sp.]